MAYDPHVKMDWVEKDVKKAVADSSLVLVLSDHSQFKEMTDDDFSTMKHAYIFDTKNVMKHDFKEVSYYNYGNIQKLQKNISFESREDKEGEALLLLFKLWEP